MAEFNRPEITWEVVSRERALCLGLDAVILSRDGFAEQLERASTPLRDAGIEIVSVDPA